MEDETALGLAIVIKEGCRYYKGKLPLECDYQRCNLMITKMPFVSKRGARGARVRHVCHRYYHIRCAEILRVI